MALAPVYPLFRVWDKKQKCFIESLDEYFNDLSKVQMYHPNIFNRENYEIQLNSGLKDTKGQFIYEGDVVLSYPINEWGACGHMNGLRKYKVCWKGVGFTMLGLKEEGCGPAWGLCEAVNEIIGNIYKNPELLK